MAARGITVPTIFTAVDKISPVIDKLSKKSSSFGGKIGSVLAKVGVGAGMYKAFSDAMNFEDKMADVAKVTNLTDAQIKNLGVSILDFSKKTRTSSTELASISEELGRLGIAGNEIEKFLPQANKFHIALSKDYSGGLTQGIQDITKASRLFKETRDLPAVDAFTKIGDAINYATTKGVKAENINDFVLRLGTLNEKIRPGLDSVMALGVAFEKTGLDSQIAASGMTGVLSNLGQETKKVATFLGICEKQVVDMFNVDPGNLFFRVAHQLSSMTGSQQMKAIKEMGMNSNEMKKVLGAIASKKGWEEYSQMFSDMRMGLSSGSIAKEAERKEATTLARWQKLTNKLMVVGIQFGEALFPIIEKFSNFVSPILENISDFIKENKILTTSIIALGGTAYAIWKVYQAFTVLKGAFIAIKALQMPGILIDTARGISMIVAYSPALSGLVGILTSVGTAIGAIMIQLAPVVSAVLILGSLLAKYEHQKMQEFAQNKYRGVQNKDHDRIIQQENVSSYTRSKLATTPIEKRAIPLKLNTASDDLVRQFELKTLNKEEQKQTQQQPVQKQEPTEVHVVLKGNTESVKETFSPSPGVKIKMSSTFNNKK